MEALTRYILDPANHDWLAVVKGLRNGIVYGAKVRFPHALVMSLLFRSGRCAAPTPRVFVYLVTVVVCLRVCPRPCLCSCVRECAWESA
jgi:hypothetical protein